MGVTFTLVEGMGVTITKGLEHPPKIVCPFTRLRKKTMVGTSGISEEDFNEAIQEKGKHISQIGFQTPRKWNNDSSDKEDFTIVFTSNKDLVLVKNRKHFD